MAVTYTFHRLRERKRKCYGSSSSSLAMAQRIRCVYDFSHVDRQTLFVCCLSAQRLYLESHRVCVVRRRGRKAQKRKQIIILHPIFQAKVSSLADMRKIFFINGRKSYSLLLEMKLVVHCFFGF